MRNFNLWLLSGFYSAFLSKHPVFKIRYRLLLFIHKIQLDQAFYDGTFWPPHESVIRTGM